MIRVEFKEPVNGVDYVMCKDISSDPMNDRVLLIRISNTHIWEVKVKLIKHIGL